MLRRATYLLLLLPGIALGQITGGTVTATSSSQGTAGQANRADCSSATTTATWNIVGVGTPQSGDKWRLATASGSCSTTVPTTFLTPPGDLIITSAAQSISTPLVGQMATEATVNCTGPSDQQVNLCLYYLPGGTSPTNPLVIAGTFTFQTAIPPAPQITSVSPGDSQLSVAVVAGTTTTLETATTGVTYTVTCSAPGAGTSTATGNAGNIVCAGLTNGVAYTVTAVGTSAAGNPGVNSTIHAAGSDTTPLPFTDFWNTYKAAGGVEQGGCGTGGAGAVAPALALVAFLAARRRRS